MEPTSIDPSQAPGMPASPKKRRGCLFYGCLTTAIAVLLSLVAMYYVASKSIKHVVETYGSQTPLDLPKTALTIGDYQDVIVRLRDFKQQLLSGAEGEPLRLAEKDLNAVLQRDPRFEGVPSAATLVDGHLVIKGSLPLEAFGYKGLYLNGEVRIAPVEGAVPPVMKIDHVSFGDKPVPQEILDQLQKEDLSKSFADDPELKDIWPRLGKVEIEGGALVLHPK